MNPEERAYELLKWQSLLPVAEFQEGFPYAKIQKERSDKALDQWDKENPYKSSPELTAFRELEFMGHYTQNDYYSPSKAANGFYTDQLKQHRKTAQDSREKEGLGREPEAPARAYKHRRKAH